jgi:hypothetical protein
MLTIIFAFRLGVGLLLLSLLFFLIFKYFDSNIRFLSLVIFVAALVAFIYGIIPLSSQDDLFIIFCKLGIYISFGIYLFWISSVIIDKKIGDKNPVNSVNLGKFLWWGLLWLILYLIFK